MIAELPLDQLPQETCLTINTKQPEEQVLPAVLIYVA